MDVVLVEIPPCVAPTPTSPTFWIPSTNILSFFVNGCGSTNPFIGVSKKQVITPDTLDCTELIPIPFELLTATIVWVTESKPFTGAVTFTSEIVWFGVIGFNEETPLKLIDFIKPNILFKGKDYKINQVIGSDLMKKTGGLTKLIDFEVGYSTTKIIEKIRKIRWL